jgi:hypothetical protein
MRPKPIRVTLALAATLVLALVASACGGGSSSTGAGEEVSPEGAPYSYTVPSGFEEVDGTFPGPEKPEFLTLVVPEGTEGEGYLNAYEWHLGDVEKKYPKKKLLVFIDQLTQKFYRSEGADISPGEDRRIAGYPAICWKIEGFKNETEGDVDADSCAIVPAPGLVVEQSCSWKLQTKSTMEKGCEELRDSMKLSAKSS